MATQTSITMLVTVDRRIQKSSQITRWLVVFVRYYKALAMCFSTEIGSLMDMDSDSNLFLCALTSYKKVPLVILKCSSHCSSSQMTITYLYH